MVLTVPYHLPPPTPQPVRSLGLDQTVETHMAGSMPAAFKAVLDAPPEMTALDGN